MAHGHVLSERLLLLLVPSHQPRGPQPVYMESGAQGRDHADCLALRHRSAPSIQPHAGDGQLSDM